MIESAIIALREGIEIALVLGILVVYLRKIERHDIVKFVYAGLVCAVAASIGGAILFQRLAIDSESLEGYFMLLAAVFVISMIIWMWITAKKIRSAIEEKVDAIISSSQRWKTQAGVFSFTFFMIVREGIETAIFLQAVALSTGAWRSILGTTIGVALATVFAILFIRGSVKIDVVRFLKVTAFTLLIFTFQLIVNALHEFFEYGILPANPKMMGILGPIVQNNVFFISAIISIPAFMMLVPGRKAAEGEQTKNQRRWQLSAGLASLCIVSFLGVGEIFSSNHEIDLSSEAIAPSADETIRIPLDKVNDGRLHRYAINDDSLEIRFFVLRTSMGKFATAFDACYACYSYGHYYLKNSELICSQCDAPSPLSKLRQSKEEEVVDENNSGSMEGNGCAPIYLPSHIHDGSIVVTMKDLRSKKKYFDITPETK